MVLFPLLKWVACKKRNLQFPPEFKETDATKYSIGSHHDLFQSAENLFYKHNKIEECFLWFQLVVKLCEYKFIKAFEYMIHIALEGGKKVDIAKEVFSKHQDVLIKDA